jgi:hypothetical protein
MGQDVWDRKYRLQSVEFRKDSHLEPGRLISRVYIGKNKKKVQSSDSTFF